MCTIQLMALGFQFKREKEMEVKMVDEKLKKIN